MRKRIIISTYDFTDSGEFALKHALKIGKFIHSNVRLLHVVNSNSELNIKRKELSKIAKKLNSLYPYKIDSTVIKGNITSAINTYADNINAIMVILAAKEKSKGLGILTGSKTLKIVLGSTTPFIVVQDYPDKITNFKNVVFPINFTIENKEKLLWAKFLDKYYNIKIKMLVEQYHDKDTLEKINANLLFAKRYLNRHNIDYEITLSKGNIVFESEIISFAESANAQLIMVMTPGSINFPDYLFGEKLDELIYNNLKIPIMCINPRVDLKRYQGFF